MRSPSLSNAAAVAATFVLRGALVATGLYAVGARGQQLLKYTTGATAAIEVGVLLWAARQAHARR